MEFGPSRARAAAAIRLKPVQRSHFARGTATSPRPAPHREQLVAQTP
ncbi:hypothetical protein SLNWT_7146 [Streptomyces albus]|uniref:Uncharacterized protein n=1 Tax=Streptomyces albus (strain ATCC 21838 / DSM 41398 / FERM P-419 / JCM 4703 / NBRC 107858) TaxID=1081613 RepID=A0A0B5FAM6_STRA4|nr:hypothetical protein SLNWT_7146 [Streptomyces albus]